MKTALIIPLYKQGKNWASILKGIESQTKIPDRVYVLLDRPELDEIKDLEDYLSVINVQSPIVNNIYVSRVLDRPSYIGNPGNPEDPLFLTGHIRNIGVELAMEDGCEIFIFIDGDCIPQKTLVESHCKKCELKVPVLSVGRRRESIYNWSDKREVDSSLMHLNLFREKGVIINNDALLHQSLIVWSCNIAMNYKAINMLFKFNELYYKRKEVFSSEFLGKWGGEDAFLGIQCNYCRVFITTIGEKSSGVEHIDHPRPKSTHNIEHMYFFKEKCEKLRKKVTIFPLTLDFFVS